MNQCSLSAHLHFSVVIDVVHIWVFFRLGEWSLVRSLNPDAYAVPSLEAAIELCRLLAGEVEDVGDATALPVVADLRSRIRLQNHFVI